MKVINTILICLAAFFSGLSLSIMSPFYPTEALKKGVTISQTGLVLGSAFITTIIFTMICGKFIQFLGARKFLILGSFVVGCGNVAFGFLESIELEVTFLVLSILINVVIAIGGSFCATSSYTLAGNMLGKKHQGKGIALVETSYGIGTMFGPTVGGILYDFGGFLLPFSTTGTLMITVALLSALLLEDLRTSSETERLPRNVTWWQIISAPGVGISIFALMFAGTGWSWYSASLGPFIKHKYGISAAQTGLVFMAFGLSYTVSTPIIGFIIDKGLNGLYASILGNFVIFFGFVCIGPMPLLKAIASLGLTVTSLSVQGVGSAFTYIGTLLFMMRAVSEAGLPDTDQTRGMVSSLWVIFDCLGGYAGTSLGSLTFDKYGFEKSTVFIGVMLILSVFVMLIYVTFRKIREKLCLYNSEEFKCFLDEKDKNYFNSHYGTH